MRLKILISNHNKSNKKMEPTQDIKKRTDFPVGMVKFIVENLPIHVTAQTVRNVLRCKTSGIRNNKTYNYRKQIVKLRNEYIKKIKDEQKKQEKQQKKELRLMKIVDNIIILRNGWQTKTARRMKVCKKTIYNILQTGKEHPRYMEMLKIAQEI